MLRLVTTVVLAITLPSTSAQAIERSRSARAAFILKNPCPATGKTRDACPGYVVDHVRPLACGGADRPENMQWQTKSDGKHKDRIERLLC